MHLVAGMVIKTAILKQIQLKKETDLEMVDKPNLLPKLKTVKK